MWKMWLQGSFLLRASEGASPFMSCTGGMRLRIETVNDQQQVSSPCEALAVQKAAGWQPTARSSTATHMQAHHACVVQSSGQVLGGWAGEARVDLGAQSALSIRKGGSYAQCQVKCRFWGNQGITSYHQMLEAKERHSPPRRDDVEQLLVHLDEGADQIAHHGQWHAVVSEQQLQRGRRERMRESVRQQAKRSVHFKLLQVTHVSYRVFFKAAT